MTKIVPVVLSGGSGMRLWPVSREGCPKPFIHFADGQTLLEKTYYRLTNLALKEIDELMPIMTVTNRDYYFLSHDELRKTGKSGTFLLEPVGRNTAPAIGLAAHLIAQQYDLDAILLVMPADHLIANQAQFIRTMRDAIEIAKLGYLLTFGIVPTHPDTGFGYIECGSQGVTGSHEVAKFIEKPNLAVAQQLFMTGKHLWNSGMFCFSAKTILNELEQHAPQLNQQILHCWQSMQHTNNESIYELPILTFEQITDISIDYAVMEKTKKAVLVPMDAGWSDVGAWSSVWEVQPQDLSGNASRGDVMLESSTNCYVHADYRLVSLLGVTNIVVIETSDAVLVAHKDSAQDVKKLVDRLKADQRPEVNSHREVFRPWGSYDSVDQGERYQVKRIRVKPGAKLSLQMHHHRAEHWIVVRGTAKVVLGETERLLSENQSIYIPVGEKHSLENPGLVELELIEVQSGSYLGEDDIVRFEDRYGRS